MILLRVYFCQVITMNKRNGGWSDDKKMWPLCQRTFEINVFDKTENCACVKKIKGWKFFYYFYFLLF